MPRVIPERIDVSPRCYAVHDPEFLDEKDRPGRYVLTIPPQSAAQRELGRCANMRWDSGLKQWWTLDGWPEILKRDLELIEAAMVKWEQDTGGLKKFRTKLFTPFRKERAIDAAFCVGDIVEHKGVLCRITDLMRMWKHRGSIFAMADLLELTAAEKETYLASVREKEHDTVPA